MEKQRPPEDARDQSGHEGASAEQGGQRNREVDEDAGSRKRRFRDALERHRRGIAVTIVGLFVVAVALAGFIWVNCGTHGCPEIENLSAMSPSEASVVVGREGEEIAKLYRVRRVIVPVDSLPEHVTEAFIAIEDEDFYEHEGVDWTRMFGAMWANLKAMEIKSGFSTITMQLARNAFPEKLPPQKQTIWRKLGEMHVALEIEDRYSKEEILGLYLNQIYFGAGAWGIEAAAQEYFGKPASELTLAEGALLAALPKAPSALNPRVNPSGADERRDLVLEQMAGQGRISRARAEEAKQVPVELSHGESRDEQRAPYFVAVVRRLLEERFGEALYTEGYTIHTTLDLDMQRIARDELEQQLEAIESGRYGVYRHAVYQPGGEVPEGGTDYVQGAVVILDAQTGSVRALVGGRDFEESKFNRATQAERQPGSAFKPFVYATALAHGYPLTYPLKDAPVAIPLASGEVWTPTNYGGGYAGVVTMRNALVHSRNVATVRLSQRVGVGQIIHTARTLGLEGEIPHVPSVVLGSAQFTPLDMASAYTAFATLGEQSAPRFVTRVEGRAGRVIWQNPPDVRRVLDPGVAFLLTDVLQDVVDRGTATAVRAVGYRGPVAGKTGTTDDATNAWFIGYTPERVGVVWIGMDEPQTIVPGATGGTLAAPVWARIMRRIPGGAGGGWAPPTGVVERLVTPRGAVVPEGCPVYGKLRSEYFLAGTVPPADCFRGRPRIYRWPDRRTGDFEWPRTEEEDESWWSDLRERFFGDDEEQRDGAFERRLPRRDRPWGERRPELQPLRDTARALEPLPRRAEPERRRRSRADRVRVIRPPRPDTPQRRPPPEPPLPAREDTMDLLGEPADTVGV